MTELMGITILEQVRLVTPYVTIGACLMLLTWLVIYITEVKVNRKWLRDPDNMERTVKDQLARKDEVIRSQGDELKVVKAELEKCRAIIRGVRSRVIGGIE